MNGGGANSWSPTSRLRRSLEPLGKIVQVRINRTLSVIALPANHPIPVVSAFRTKPGHWRLREIVNELLIERVCMKVNDQGLLL